MLLGSFRLVNHICTIKTHQLLFFLVEWDEMDFLKKNFSKEMKKSWNKNNIN